MLWFIIYALILLFEVEALILLVLLLIIPFDPHSWRILPGRVSLSSYSSPCWAHLGRVLKFCHWRSLRKEKEKRHAMWSFFDLINTFYFLENKMVDVIWLPIWSNFCKIFPICKAIELPVYFRLHPCELNKGVLQIVHGEVTQTLWKINININNQNLSYSKYLKIKNWQILIFYKSSRYISFPQN